MEGIWAVARGWRDERGWSAASHVDKRTEDKGSSCLWALQLPSLAVLLEESGIVPTESKGLALKFRLGCRCFFFPPSFYKQHFLDRAIKYIFINIFQECPLVEI